MRDHRLQTARILLLGSVLAAGLQTVLPVAVGADADGGSLSQALVVYLRVGIGQRHKQVQQDQAAGQQSDG